MFFNSLNISFGVVTLLKSDALQSYVCCSQLLGAVGAVDVIGVDDKALVGQ